MSPTEGHKPEEQSTPAAPPPAGPGVGGVMDVKPTQKPADTPSPLPIGAPTAERSEAMPQEASTAPPPEGDKMPGLSADLLAEAKKAVEGKSSNPNDSSAAHAPKQKSNLPKAAIIVAIVVALLLSAAAVFAYLKTKDGSNNKPTVVNTTNQPSAATTEDVDEASKEVEKTINSVAADQDLPESELSEQTLGL
jgi:hypothetical protein